MNDPLAFAAPALASVSLPRYLWARAAAWCSMITDHRPAIVSPMRREPRSCFAYALAEATGEPRLFKGNDYSRTGVPPALTPEGDARA